MSSGSEVEIKITTRGVGVEAHGAERASAGVPEPAPEMGAAMAGTGAATEAAPTPMGALGVEASEAPPAPSPQEAAFGAAATDLPVPVPLEEISQLGTGGAQQASSEPPAPDTREE